MLTRNVVIFAIVAIAIVVAVIYFSIQEDDEDEKKEKDDSRVPTPPILNPDKVESATTKEGEEKPKKEFVKKFANIGGFESSMVKQVNMTSSEALKLSPDMEKGIYARGTSGNEQIQEMVYQYRPKMFEIMNKGQ